MVPLLDMDEWDFIRTLEVNLCGAFFTSQQVGRAMRAQGGGVILNIAAAFGPSGGPEESAAFIASKQGLIGLTRAAARELSPYNIRVNAICPGWTETEGVLSSSKAQNLMRTAAQALPQNRPGQADQVAELALFLAGDRAAQITGQVVEVEGRLAMD
jgi:3-oxoacyl-[acyl-carrier protein] reductase